MLYFLYFPLNVTNRSFSLQVVLDDLSRAREGFVLASDLHLVYLVTPINVDVEPDWELYYERFMQLSTLEQVHMCSLNLQNSNIWFDLLLNEFLAVLNYTCLRWTNGKIFFLTVLIPEMLNAHTLPLK